MEDICELTQVRKIRGLVSEDNELSAAFNLMIVLCNLLLNSGNDDIIKILEEEITSFEYSE
jgi:hypothetical protein